MVHTNQVSAPALTPTPEGGLRAQSFKRIFSLGYVRVGPFREQKGERGAVSHIVDTGEHNEIGVVDK